MFYHAYWATCSIAALYFLYEINQRQFCGTINVNNSTSEKESKCLETTRKVSKLTRQIYCDKKSSVYDQISCKEFIESESLAIHNSLKGFLQVSVSLTDLKFAYTKFINIFRFKIRIVMEENIQKNILDA